MGWLKYVVAGAAGALVGGPVGAVAAVGVVKGASSIKKTMDDDKEKQEKIQREHEKTLAKTQIDQTRRDLALEEERQRAEEMARRNQQAAKERQAAEEEKRKLELEQKTQLLIAQFAIGFAASHIDGTISKDEMNELAQFIKSSHENNMPTGVIQKVKEFQVNPPSLKDAWAEINRLANPDYAFFRKLIELIINADGGTPKDEEIQFLKEFDYLASTSK